MSARVADMACVTGHIKMSTPRIVDSHKESRADDVSEFVTGDTKKVSALSVLTSARK